MPKRTFAPTLLFAGSCALGALLFLGGTELRSRTDAWARISRASSPDGYVASRDSGQGQIPLGVFYDAMTDLLKKEYVEPIKDDQKLATGAVRGMVVSLGDPRCVFMDKDEFRVFLSAREGRYEGIGAEFGYEGLAAKKPKQADANDEPSDDPHDAVLTSRLPYLVATMVVPGGPADRAGVRPGDVVADIDGHWVVDDAEIVRFNKARDDFAAKKISFSTVAKMQSELKKKVQRALMPAKAKDRLSLGTTGTVTVIWRRNGVARTTKIVKGTSTVSPFAVKGGAYTLRFDSEAPGRLRNALKGKTKITLDLRNNVDGDFEAMRGVLAILAPNGEYGLVTTQKKEAPMPLTVVDGNARPPKITLLVDRTTRGPAAILARALNLRHLATLVGGPVGGDMAIREVVQLPDATGYTLVTGEYQADGSATKVAFKENPS